MPQNSYLRQKNLQARNGAKKPNATTQKSTKKPITNRDKKKTDKYREYQVTEDGTWYKGGSGGLSLPGGGAAFRALLSARCCGAVWCHITDCDEVFNYWEPLHYLMYNWGLQTWEYSSLYALRSYAYLWIAAIPSLLVELICGNTAGPPLPFYITRCCMALASAGADLYMYKAICLEFGVNVSRLWLAFTLCSAGSFISGAALLPSSWASILSTIAMAALWKKNYPVAVGTVAISTLLCWPFAGLIGLPIAIDLVFRQNELINFLRWSLLSLAFVLGPMVYIDSFHYGQLVIAPLNLIKYNIFTDHGPDLYGIEPWTYYLINGFLNYNVVWIMSLLCPFLLFIYWLVNSSRPRAAFCRPYWISLMPLYSWLAVFMLQPHKEERFLFPVYSMISLCGAIGVDTFQRLVFKITTTLQRCILSRFFCNKASSEGKTNNSSSHYAQKTTFIMIAFIVLSSALGVSRSVSLYRNYHAPMDILRSLADEQLPAAALPVNVCYAKEWHRFPSSFLFPDHRFRVKFVKSEFKGMLPAYYSKAHNATMLAPDHFNDQNKEDPRLYTNIDECHYLVDSTIGDQTTLEPRYSEDTSKWTLVTALPFLDTSKSDKFFRAFYIPILSDRYLHFGEYHLLRNTKVQV